MDVSNDPRLPDFTSRASTRALVVGVLALAVSVVGAFTNPTQFHRSYLAAFVFWNGLAVGSLAVLMLQYLTGGAWGIAIRRELEAATRTLPVGLVFFIPVALGIHRVYEWSHADVVAKDELLQKKALYLNAPFFIVRAAVAFAGWMLLAYFLGKWSRQQDAADEHRALDRKLQLLSGGGLVFYALSVTWTSIDWVMSLEPHWYSTMYGVIFMVNQALGALALAVLAVLRLSPLEPVKSFLGGRHLHDLGKMMFAFVMIWAYVNFSQYLIVWSGNLPEEIGWYLARFRGGWGMLGLAILLFHFVLPFLLLLSRQANRNPRLLGETAALLVLMRFLDVAWLVLPAFSAGAFRIHWLDLTVPIGLGGVWVSVYARNLAARPLLPVHDPGFEEALAHGRE